MSQPATRSEPDACASPRGKRFLGNVLWNWVAAGANLFTAGVLSPYIIRKLGEERYGIWALVFSVVDYFGFFDLGFNTAVVNFVARFWATGDIPGVRRVVNTAFFYFAAVSGLILALTIIASRRLSGFFQVTEGHRHEFAVLVLLAGISWSAGTVLNVFTSCLEGFQRFDLTCRAWAVSLVVRSGASAVALALGYGLIEMGLVFVATQLIWYGWNFWNVRRVCPGVKISPRHASVPALVDMARYGMHSFLANVSNLLLTQSAPVIIGHFRSPMFVGFFTLPSRLVQYAVDMVARVGQVTRVDTAALVETGRREEVARLGRFSNRYCFALFTPVVIFLLVYGRDLIRIWVGPQFERYSAPLLPVLVTATAFVIAGQFNSSAILFGLGRHKRYAQGLLAEAVLSVVGLIVIVPRYGIWGAVWVSAVLMAANRGVVAPWLVCRNLNCSFFMYMESIYLRPLATAAPVAAGAWWMRAHWLPGRTWAELICACTVIAAVYLVLALFTCAEREHRNFVWGWVTKRARAAHA